LLLLSVLFALGQLTIGVHLILFNVKQRMMFCRSGASRECQSSRLAPLLQSFIIRSGHKSM